MKAIRTLPSKLELQRCGVGGSSRSGLVWGSSRSGLVWAAPLGSSRSGRQLELAAEWWWLWEVQCRSVGLQRVSLLASPAVVLYQFWWTPLYLQPLGRRGCSRLRRSIVWQLGVVALLVGRWYLSYLSCFCTVCCCPWLVLLTVTTSSQSHFLCGCVISLLVCVACS